MLLVMQLFISLCATLSCSRWKMTVILKLEVNTNPQTVVSNAINDFLTLKIGYKSHIGYISSSHTGGSSNQLVVGIFQINSNFISGLHSSLLYSLSLCYCTGIGLAGQGLVNFCNGLAYV